MPTVTSLLDAFKKILNKHLTANKSVNFSFQQQASMVPIMNPSSRDVVRLFTFAEVTLIQYSTIQGHMPGPHMNSLEEMETSFDKDKKKKKKKHPKDPNANALQPTSLIGVTADAVTPRDPPPAPPKDQGANAQTPVRDSQRSRDQSPTRRDKDKDKGKGKGKGKGKKRNQQCIPFYRGLCKRGDKCLYEHQVGSDGRPVPVGQEFLQRYDEAAARNAQARGQGAPKGLSASMLLLDDENPPLTIPDRVMSHSIRVSDSCFAMMDSGTNAVILPLHPDMCGEVAECQVPGTTVHATVVQQLSHGAAQRLVVALPNSAILIFQEWLTVVAGWKVIAARRGGEGCVDVYTAQNPNNPQGLTMSNGLPYLSKQLFWEAMEDIARNTMLMRGHSLQWLKEKVNEQVTSKSLHIHAVQEVRLVEVPNISLNYPQKSNTFSPARVANKTAKLFDELQPQVNPNRSRLTKTSATLTFGAQTGRGSDVSCIIARTKDPQYQSILAAVHSLAQASQSSLPYLGMQILRLNEETDLSAHRDYHNHPEFPNHTLNFGTFQGGQLEMLRNGVWSSYARTMVWLSFDALKVVHRVTPVSSGTRFSITLYTPGKLERLTAEDWDYLGRNGFPIYLYDAYRMMPRQPKEHAGKRNEFHSDATLPTPSVMLGV